MPDNPRPGDPGTMTQWQLVRRRFSRHKLAMVSIFVLIALYLAAVFAEFVAPYRPTDKHLEQIYTPPHGIHFNFTHGLHTYPLEMVRDPRTLTMSYRENRDRVIPLGFFVRGVPYRLWGLIPMEHHLFGVAGKTQEPGSNSGDGDGSASIPTETGSALTEAAEPATGDTAPNPLTGQSHAELPATRHNSEVANPEPHVPPPGETPDLNQKGANREEGATPPPAGSRLAPFFLLGADKYGRDLFSRIVYGARISLSIGLVSIAVSFLLGVVIGGVSGYLGGTVDVLIQRLIEILQAIPKLPLWIALGAILPADWPSLWVYFGIILVLSFIGWTGLARTVRSKLLSLREEDYAVAARLLGASHSRIIFRHLVPGFTSHIIVSLSLAIPRMILGETALSFLGIGLRPPLVSWGVLLQDCLDLDILSRYPWIIMPTVFVVLTVLAFNFLGDGMRDAADPYH